MYLDIHIHTSNRFLAAIAECSTRSVVVDLTVRFTFVLIVVSSWERYLTDLYVYEKITFKYTLFKQLYEICSMSRVLKNKILIYATHI